MSAVRLVALAFLYITAIVQTFGQNGLQSTLERTLEQALNASKDEATAATNGFIGIYLLFGVVGGFVADRIGRRGNYVVNLVCAFIWALGALVMCVPRTPALDWPTALIGLFFTCVGYGAINPTQVVLVSSQFDVTLEPEAEAKAIAYLYFAYNIGALAGESAGPQLRHSFGYDVALTAFFAAVLAGAVFFAFGTPMYRNALRINNNNNNNNDNDNAAAADDEETRPILTKTSTSASMTLNRFHALLILIPIPIFYTILFQQNSTMVSQGGKLDTRLGDWSVPPDIMASLEDWFLLLIIPLLDVVIFPRVAWLRAPTAEESANERNVLHDLRHLVARMTLGMAASALAMFSCSMLSLFATPMQTSILCQIPALVCLSVSEGLVAISGLQLVVAGFRKLGGGSEGIATALWLALGAVGSFAGAGIAKVPWSDAAAFGAWSAAGFAWRAW
jgi:dipeptide/tripeptide permease